MEQMEEDTKNIQFSYLQFQNAKERNQRLYLTDQTLVNLKLMSVDDNYIFQILSDETQNQLRQFQDRLQNTIKGHSIMFDILLKIHQIIEFVNIITLQNSFQEGARVLSNHLKVRIVSNITYIYIYQLQLECEQVSLYVVEIKEQQLWCVNNRKPGSISTFSLSEGIAGHVVQSGSMMNVQKIKHDNVHSNMYDRTHQLVYQNVLAVPVKDPQNNQVMAVLECVNKTPPPGQEPNHAFTFIDQNILQLSLGFGIYLVTQKLQKSQEESVLTLNRLRHVLHSGMLFNNEQSIGKLMILAEERMMTGINSLQCYFYRACPEQKLIRYTLDEQGQIKETKTNMMGVFQYLIERKKSYCRLKNCYNHPYFNMLVDINTHQPVLVGLVIHPSDPNTILSAFQVKLNSNYNNLTDTNNASAKLKVRNSVLQGDVTNYEEPLHNNYIELLEFFIPQFTQSILRITQKKQLFEIKSLNTLQTLLSEKHLKNISDEHSDTVFMSSSDDQEDKDQEQISDLGSTKWERKVVKRATIIQYQTNKLNQDEKKIKEILNIKKKLFSLELQQE